MKNTLKIEEAAMFILGLCLYWQIGYSWWWFMIFFFTPDIGMLGYVFNARAGAFGYNLLHNKAIAIFVYFLGIFTSMDYLSIAGIILFAHSSFDRMLGYGLKLPDSFNNTHLGTIGKKQ